jgi:hypothetical protein
VQKDTAVGFRHAGFEVLRVAQRAQSGWKERPGKFSGGFVLASFSTHVMQDGYFGGSWGFVLMNVGLLLVEKREQ